MSKFGPTGTILPSPPVTRRPPGAKFLYRNAQFLRRSLSLIVMALRTVPGGPDGARVLSWLSRPGEIRGVSHHCRIVTYRNALNTAIR